MLLPVWPGLRFWYCLGIFWSPSWVFLFAIEFVKKTTGLVSIFLLSALVLSWSVSNFMLSMFHFSLLRYTIIDRFLRDYEIAANTMGYTVFFFVNVGLYYFSQKSVAYLLAFLSLDFYWFCTLLCIQPYTDFGALEILHSANLNQTLRLFGLRSSYSWLVIIVCIVISGIRYYCLKSVHPPEDATRDEIELESGLALASNRGLGSPGLTTATSPTSGTPDDQALITKARDGYIHLNRVPRESIVESTESILLNTVESTESAPPELTSEATESVPPNATTLSLTSVRRESIVKSTKSVHQEETSESTGSGSSEVTTKPTEGVVPRDVTNSSIASAPSSNPPQLTPSPNASAPSPGLNVAASSLTSGTPDDQELITKARDDIIHLNRAFAGPGCDEATLVKILAHRSSRHRTLIRQEYKTKFSKDFDNRLSKGLFLNPHLKRALLLWMDEPANRDAKIVKHGLSKNLNVAIEVICSRTPSQLEELKKAYRTLFSAYLDEDIESHAHGDNKKLLVAYASTIRSESPEVDAAMVDKDAKDLFKDGEWRPGTNEETFIRIFSEKSSAHLAALNSAYCKMYVNSLKKAVKKETSSKFKFALLTILQCAENPGKYFAKALHKAMAGLGTDDETLTRIIVSRAEVDIEKIKEEYHKKYGKPLSDDVHSDTSGNYRSFLISLLNPNV